MNCQIVLVTCLVGSVSMFGTGMGQVYRTAVHTRQHQIEYRDVPALNRTNPSSVQILSRHLPVMLMFKSASTRLTMRQVHESGNGSTKETSSEDEPQSVVHVVTKPIIQELRHLISPMKRVVQQVAPVQEEVLTVIAHNDEVEKDLTKQDISTKPALETTLDPSYDTQSDVSSSGTTVEVAEPEKQPYESDLDYFN